MTTGSVQFKKLKSGIRWYVVLRQDGKQVFVKGSGSQNRREAQARLSRMLGRDIINENINFSDFAQEYLESAQLRVKPSTFERYQSIVDLHLSPILGPLKLSRITLPTLECLIDDKIRAGLAPATVNKIIVVAKIIFKRARRYKQIIDDPAEYLKRLTVEKKDKDFLRPEDIGILLDHIQINVPKWYPFLMVAVFTGARISELLALKWSDINWKTDEIRFGASLFRGKVLSNKTNTIALVEVPTEVTAALKTQEHIITPDDLIFVHRDGKPYDRTGVYKWVFKKALRGAGLREVTFHSLRHSFNSIMLSTGANLKVVQDQVRHKTLDMTLNTYGHALKADKARAVREVADRILHP